MRKVSIWENTKRFWGFIRNHKTAFFTLLFVIFIVESSYVIDKYLFKLLIDSGTEFTNGTYTHAMFVDVLVLLAVVLGLILIVRGVGKWLFQELLIRIDVELIRDLKLKFFNHIVHLDYNFHTTHKTGSLITRMTRGGRAIETMMDSIAFNFASLFFALISSAVALSTIGIEIGLILIVSVVLFILYSVHFFRVMIPLAKKANDTEDKEKGNIGDIFTNIESIKYYGKEHKIKERYSRLSKDTFNAFAKSWKPYRWADGGQTVIFTLGAVALLWLPILRLLNGTATIGDLAFAYTIYLSLAGPVYGFMFGVRMYYRSMVDFESLFEYESFSNEIPEKPKAPEMHVTTGKIEFKDISFGYQNSQLFKNFNLTIEPNTKIALVGRSGAGKSTLVKLLYRFYDSDMGSIEIDGVNIKDVQQESLRSELSIVPQEGVLFDDTIFNNIKFSKPGASDDEVRKAIKFAQLDTLIENLPKKDKTIVGERGVRLSGGERQRVSIARALLANKKILVLDEATSALDSETEHDIQNDLQDLMKNRTSIIIAHRLSTIMSADKIIVLEGGEIVQEGTHDELVKKPGLYKRLWGMQRGGYIE